MILLAGRASALAACAVAWRDFAGAGSFNGYTKAALDVAFPSTAFAPYPPKWIGTILTE